MPLYDYECRCGYRFSSFRRMAEAAKPAACHACGGRHAKRVFGCPALQTDTTFMADRPLDGGQFKYEGERAFMRAAAAKAGQSLNGRFYLSQVARFPGDPEAWVSDKWEARRLAERRGAGCPELGTRRREVEPDARPDLADDLAAEQAAKTLDQRGVPVTARTPKVVADAVAEAKARHGVRRTNARPAAMPKLSKRGAAK